MKIMESEFDKVYEELSQLNEDVLQEAGKGELLDDWFVGYQIFYSKLGEDLKLYKILNRANDAIELAKKLSRQSDIDQVDIKPIGSEKVLISFSLGTDTKNNIRELMNYARNKASSEESAIDLCIKNLVNGQEVDFSKYSDDWLQNLYRKCSDYATYSSYKDSYIKPKEMIKVELQKRNSPILTEAVLQEAGKGATLDSMYDTYKVLQKRSGENTFKVFKVLYKANDAIELAKRLSKQSGVDEVVVKPGKEDKNLVSFSFGMCTENNIQTFINNIRAADPDTLGSKIFTKVNTSGGLSKQAVKDFKTENPAFRGWRGR